MIDTYGQSSGGSSPSADLQLSLESRLRAHLEETGSPEYTLTWKHWGINSQLRICALRASAPRTLGSDCGGWPTCRANDAEKRGQVSADKRNGLAGIAGWGNPTTRDWKDGVCAKANVPHNGLLGRMPPMLLALTGCDGECLDPAFSRWLMGYPEAWDLAAPNQEEWSSIQQELIEKVGCGPTEMQSYRK